MNNVSLVGNIATDIDLKATPQGHYVANFNLAVTNPFNRDKTSFVPIQVWRKQAENVSSYCTKGSKIGVVGHIEIDSYEKDGQRRSFTKVVAGSVEFLTPKSNSSGQPNSSGGQAPAQQQYGQQSGYEQQQYTPPGDDPFSGGGPVEVSDDDLPF